MLDNLFLEVLNLTITGVEVLDEVINPILPPVTQSEASVNPIQMQCHLKRFDHVTRLLAFVALAVHWFNPLVWAAFVLSERDMELSCDEAVMGTMKTDIRRDYATSLLRFATRGRLISATPLAFGEGDIKGRVKNVMGYKKPVIWVTVAAIVLAVCVGVGLMSNAKQQG